MPFTKILQSVKLLPQSEHFFSQIDWTIKYYNKPIFLTISNDPNQFFYYYSEHLQIYYLLFNFKTESH